MGETVKFKTVREALDFYQTYPRGRRIVGYVSTVGWLVLFVALFLAVYLQIGFISYLVLAFLMFLCTTHSNYALAQNLTQAKVRRIDYWYLGVAAVGLLLFAAGYSSQRDAVLTRILVAAHQAAEEPVRQKVTESIEKLTALICDPKVSVPKTCEGVRRFGGEIKPHLSEKQVKELNERFMKEVILPYAKTFPLEKLNAPGIFSPFSVVTLRLDDWEAHMRELPGATLVKHDEDAEMLFGLGQLVLWPFLLAYALALRITKVTIDVFEWAK
jgi:hypothetical protein